VLRWLGPQVTPGPAGRALEEVGFQLAEAHQQVPHLHRPRYSTTHPGEEALQKAKRGQASIGCQDLQQIWPTPDTTAAAEYPNFSDLGPVLLQAALVRDELVAPLFVPLLCEPCAVDGLWMG
jgi:hypothetical protein